MNRFNKFDCRLFVVLFCSFVLQMSLLELRIWTEISSDAAAYEELATSLSTGKGYKAGREEHFFFPPGYPFMVAAVYRILGNSPQLFRAVQSTIFVLALWVFYHFARLYLDERYSLVAAAMLAANPMFWASSKKYSADYWYSILLLVFIYLSKKLFDAASQNEAYRNWRFAVILGFLGMLSGYISLVKEVGMLLPLLLSLLFVCEPKVVRLHFRFLGAFFLVSGFVLVISPWTYRNYVKSGGYFIPVTAHGGLTLYAAHFPRAGKIYGNFPEDDPVVLKARSMSQFEGDRYYKQVVKKRFLEDPTFFFKAIPLKCLHFFAPFDYEVLPGDGSAHRPVFNWFLPILLILSTAGIWISLKNRIGLFLFLPLVQSLLIVVLFYGIPRFRMPYEPYLVIFSAFALKEIQQRRSRVALNTLLVSAAALCFGLYLWSDSVKAGVKVLIQYLGIW